MPRLAFKFQIYQATDTEWRWRVLAGNGKVVADSGEGYQRRVAARRACEKLRDYFYLLPVEEHEKVIEIDPTPPPKRRRKAAAKSAA